MEEFDMHISVGDPFAVFTYANNIKGSHAIEVIYFATYSDPIANIAIHPADHSSFGWFAEHEITNVASINRRDDDPEILAIKRALRFCAANACCLIRINLKNNGVTRPRHFEREAAAQLVPRASSELGFAAGMPGPQ